MAQEIDKAYYEVTGTKVSDILDKYREDYRLSIEDFADQVNAYIESKEPNFRLNFFVDEVGQYIADNVKLMTNLQTVAESLATKCKGRSWVVVTAQEDMSAVLGDGTQQSNDFSKIQARFKNRMKLNSQDVAEVIQMRLLDKRQEYINDLQICIMNKKTTSRRCLTCRRICLASQFRIGSISSSATRSFPISSRCFSLPSKISRHSASRASTAQCVSGLCRVSSSKLPSVSRDMSWISRYLRSDV